MILFILMMEAMDSSETSVRFLQEPYGVRSPEDDILQRSKLIRRTVAEQFRRFVLPLLKFLEQFRFRQ
jgi:hypothetical protein